MNKLLTLGQNQGSFGFSVTNNEGGNSEVVSEFNVQLKRNLLPVVNCDNKYIFHVFNDDYVKENLEELRYNPNGHIEGYILGKEKIDISKEKSDLVNLNLDLLKKNELINKAIDTAKKELEDLGIRGNTREFSVINYENIINNNTNYIESESFDELKVKLSVLKSAPENLADLDSFRFMIENSTLSKIQDYLESEFTRSNIAQDFKAKVRSKQQFIEDGIQLLGLLRR